MVTGLTKLNGLAPLGLVVALALPAAAQAVVVVPVTGGVGVSAYVSDYVDGNIDTNTSTDAFGSLPASLAATASAVVTDSNGGSITAQGEVYADWSAAGDAGAVQARNFGWQYSSGGLGQAIVAAASPWYYQFTTPSDAVLTWTYDVRGFVNIFGLWGFQLYVDGNAIGATLDPYDPSSNGLFSVNLAGGQSHTLSLVTNANIEAGGDVFGFMDGDFSWSIASAGVPEPASWSMMIAGFGFVGGALRARRRAVA